MEAVEGQVAEYVRHVDLDEFRLYWEIARTDNRPVVQLLYDRVPSGTVDTFATEHRRKDTWRWRGRCMNARDVVDDAQLALREHVEAHLPPESAAAD